jgi:hypothetical protein
MSGGNVNVGAAVAVGVGTGVAVGAGMLVGAKVGVGTDVAVVPEVTGGVEVGVEVGTEVTVGAGVAKASIPILAVTWLLPLLGSDSLPVTLPVTAKSPAGEGPASSVRVLLPLQHYPLHPTGRKL